MMNSVILKQALRLIGTENITKTADSLFKEIISRKRDIELQSNETDIAAMIYEIDGEIYMVQVVLNDENKITRFLSDPISVRNFIEKQIENL